MNEYNDTFITFILIVEDSPTGRVFQINRVNHDPRVNYYANTPVRTIYTGKGRTEADAFRWAKRLGFVNPIPGNVGDGWKNYEVSFAGR